MIFITVQSHECRMSKIIGNSVIGSATFPDQQQIKYHGSVLLALCDVNPLVIGGFPSQKSNSPGARLTKAYDVTIQRYRNSHAKIDDSKMHILWCMGSQFCVKFQRCPLKFHTNFQPIHHKICILRGVKKLTTYDILEL